MSCLHPWATATTNSALLNANQWEHIVYVFNSTTDTIYSYLNGALVNSSKIQSGTTIGQNSLSLLIGEGRWMNNGNPSYLFNGILDDIRIYDVALTPCDVDSLYNMPNPLTGISEIAATKNVKREEKTDASSSLNTNINLYPNPNNGSFTLEYNLGTEMGGNVKLYSAVGELVGEYTLTGYEGKLSITNNALSNGVYFYKAFTNTHQVLKIGKVVIIK